MAFSPTAMAEANLKVAVTKKAATLYNPYEGQFCGRQLNETVEEFLQRLPPQTTTASDLIPWIYIANPYRKAANAEDGQEIKGEGPPDEESDWAQFVVLGGNMLEELTGIRHDIEKEKPGKAKATITKAYNPHKDLVVQKLLDTAAGLHCTSGKVIVPPSATYMIWLTVQLVDDVCGFNRNQCHLVCNCPLHSQQ